MGCTISKPEEETTILHCKLRCSTLLKSIQYRYALSEAHGDYTHSLHSLSSSLHAFLLQSLPPSSHLSPLQIPSNRGSLSIRSTSTRIKFDSARSSSRVDHAGVIINRSKHHVVPSVQVQSSPTQLQNSPVQVQNSNFANPYPYPPHMEYRMPLPPMSSFFNTSNNNNNDNNQSFWRHQSPRLQVQEPVVPLKTGSSSPDNSSWDFLNPFVSYHNYYESYTPNPSFRQVREAEGIPELEEVNDEEDAHNNTVSASASKRISVEKADSENNLNSVRASVSNSFRSSFGRSFRGSFARERIKDEVVGEKDEARVYRNDAEIVLEVKNQFERVAEAAEQISGLLEVGKKRYSFKNSIRKVAGRMLCGFTSPPNSIDDESSHYQHYRAMDNSSLSITMQKLYMWERKLLEEVQIEEKLANEYQRKCDELNNYERGADREQMEEMQIKVKKISTKIKITLRVLGSISKKIHEIRDEELWPQVSELVEGLLKMWEVMFKSHRVQLNAISQIESHFSSSANFSEIHFEATKKLQLDLITWLTNFSIWVNCQRNYVQSLNTWLKTGLNHERELTEDGFAPFSPSRLGLPQIFIILNNWSEIMEKSISEAGLTETIQSFTTRVSHLHEMQKYEQHQKLLENKDLKELRIMEMGEKLLRKKFDSYNKKFASISRYNYVNLSPTEMQSGVNSLKTNLRRVFEALESFAFINSKAYEELHMQSNEDVD